MSTFQPVCIDTFSSLKQAENVPAQRKTRPSKLLIFSWSIMLLIKYIKFPHATLIALWWLILCYLTCSCVTFNLLLFLRARGTEPVSRGMCWSCVCMCVQVHCTSGMLPLLPKRYKYSIKIVVFFFLQLNKKEEKSSKRSGTGLTASLCEFVFMPK